MTMGLLDYGYLFFVCVIAVFGLYNLLNYANKRRNDSIRDYMNGKEKRIGQFQKR